MAINPSSGKDDRLNSPSMESVRDATNAIDGGHPLEPKAAPAQAKQVDPVFKAYENAKANQATQAKESSGKGGGSSEQQKAAPAPRPPGMNYTPQTKPAKDMDQAMAKTRINDYTAEKKIENAQNLADKDKSNLVNSKDMENQKETDKTR